MAAEGIESAPNRYAVEVVMVGLFLFGLPAAVCVFVCAGVYKQGCNKSALLQMFLHSSVLKNHYDLEVGLISSDSFISLTS